MRGDEQLSERLRRLEGELDRARRSRRVLMDLLVRFDRRWRQQISCLEEENRRLWAARGGSARKLDAPARRQ